MLESYKCVEIQPPEMKEEYCFSLCSYRVLLDAWHLWNQRAHFDILLSASSPSDKPPQQVFVSCNFCGKSISAQMLGIIRNRVAFARLGATLQKVKVSRYCYTSLEPLCWSLDSSVHL
jgi:hypothetical protein